MSTFDDLLAEINKLPTEQQALSDATDASHAALQAVTDVTNQQQALIDAANAAAVTAEASAKTAADTAVKATSDASDSLNASLDKVIALATLLRTVPPISTTPST